MAHNDTQSFYRQYDFSQELRVLKTIFAADKKK